MLMITEKSIFFLRVSRGCLPSDTPPVPALAPAGWRAAAAFHYSSWYRTVQSCSIKNSNIKCNVFYNKIQRQMYWKFSFFKNILFNYSFLYRPVVLENLKSIDVQNPDDSVFPVDFGVIVPHLNDVINATHNPAEQALIHGLWTTKSQRELFVLDSLAACWWASALLMGTRSPSVQLTVREVKCQNIWVTTHSAGPAIAHIHYILHSFQPLSRVITLWLMQVWISVNSSRNITKHWAKYHSPTGAGPQATVNISSIHSNNLG